MRTLRVKNFRGFKDSGAVPLHGITVLVGANSSGKSSFLRVLPLLRQSVETATTGPILWFDPRLVDFGSYSEARRRGAENGTPIELEFGLTLQRDSFTMQRGRSGLQGSQINPRVDSLGTVEAAASVCLREGPQGTYASGVSLRCGQDSVSADFGEDGKLEALEINGSGFDLPGGQRWGGGLLPAVFSAQDERYDPTGGGAPLLDALRPIGHGNTTDETFEEIAERLVYGTDRQVWESLRSSSRSEYWRTQLGPWTGRGSARVRRVRQQLFRRDFTRLLLTASEELGGLARSTAYIKPFRASPERYYRLSDLAVDELDSVGGNLAMFVRSLTETEKESFADWLRQHLDFDIRAQKEGGNVAIMVKESGGESFNLVDMGFGFSQVLPVLAQLWLAHSPRLSRKRVRRPVRLIAVEQPELHLHPRHQASLADMFVAAVNAGRRSSGAPGLRAVIETHSMAFISRLGELVEDGTISRDDVGIALFSKEEGACEVGLSSFDEAGVLKNWPPGFLSR